MKHDPAQMQHLFGRVDKKHPNRFDVIATFRPDQGAHAWAHRCAAVPAKEPRHFLVVEMTYGEHMRKMRPLSGGTFHYIPVSEIPPGATTEYLAPADVMPVVTIRKRQTEYRGVGAL